MKPEPLPCSSSGAPRRADTVGNALLNIDLNHSGGYLLDCTCDRLGVCIKEIFVRRCEDPLLASV